MASVEEQYRQEIEEAISKAKASGERETVGALDGGKPMRILTSAAFHGASTPLRLA
jgi:hypothetical protein